jgi:hypothetical protein
MPLDATWLRTWLETPERRALPRVALWTGELCAPAEARDALLELSALDDFLRLAEARDAGLRFLDLQVEGERARIVGFDAAEDFERHEEHLVEVLGCAAALGVTGTVLRFSGVGVAIGEDGASEMRAAWWVEWTLANGDCAVDEDERTGSEPLEAALATALGAAAAWYRAHPEARVALENRGRYGFVDREGRIVVAPTLLHAAEVSEGHAPVTVEDGATLLSIGADGARLVEGRWVRIDHFLRGRAPVLAFPGRVERWGYIDAGGALVIPALYAEAKPFYGPLAQVREGTGLSGPSRWITPEGTLVGEPFDLTLGFSEGLAWSYVHALASYGCTDERGEPAFGARFRSVGRFAEGLAAAFDEPSGKYGYVDRHGRMVIAPRFDQAGPFACDRAVVRLGRQAFILDRDGERVGEPIEPALQEAFSEGMLPVRVRGEVGFVDRDGNLAIAARFAEAYGFFEGLAYAAVKVDGDTRWGHLDPSGHWHLEPTLEWTNRFSDGRAPARRAGRHGFVDREGRWVVTPRWKEAQTRFSEGFAWVRLP